MSTIETIRCRAKLGADCFDGSPMSRQMPGDAPQTPEDPALMMAEDGTYDGESIVCDPCYVKLCPLTQSGAALHDEIPEAIDLYRANVEYVRRHEDPHALVKDAERKAEQARPGSPYWASARAMRKIAQAEVDRRAVS
jgi:hypothetical protein